MVFNETPLLPPPKSPQSDLSTALPKTALRRASFQTLTGPQPRVSRLGPKRSARTKRDMGQGECEEGRRHRDRERFPASERSGGERSWVVRRASGRGEDAPGAEARDPPRARPKRAPRDPRPASR
ncbi:hypothetical protein KM043_006240 [Ampulex compressa]|nr:hypothetical protein KM043_006240 [Ampulex compressa]